MCVAPLDAAIDRARASAAQEAPAAWAAVDRRVVDLAAAVPYVNPRVIVYVSKRVGNVISHPMYQTLLEQIWVSLTWAIAPPRKTVVLIDSMMRGARKIRSARARDDRVHRKAVLTDAVR